MTEAQKSFKRKLQNDGLYVDDSTGIPILRDGKGRVIGGGGGGSVVPSDKQQNKAPMARSLVIDGEPWNMTGIITEIEMHATGDDTFEGVIGIEGIQDIVLRNARLKVNLTTAAGNWTLFASDITILDGQQGDAVFAALVPFPGNRVMVLSIDDSFGVKGVLVGLGGGGGGDKEIINVALTKSGSSGNFTGSITAEQKEKLRNMKAVLRATLIGSSPTTVVYYEIFAHKSSSKGVQLWGVNSYFGGQVAILWIAEDNSVVVEPITFYSKLEIGNMLNEKQNTITSGTSAPTGGTDGDIYIQYGE